MGLNSVSVIRILDLLCEGPIEGIEGGRRGIFLDETPLRSANNAEQISDDLVTYEFTEGVGRLGRVRQIKNGLKTSIPMVVGRTFGNIDDETGELITTYKERKTEDNKVKSRNYAAGDLNVTVDDLETDSIDLIFTVDRLFSTAQEGLVKGQLFDAKIFFDVFIKNKNRSTYQRVKKVDVAKVSEDFKTNGQGDLFYIEGQATANYQYKISGIELDGEGPWNIKVRKYPGDRFRGFIPHSKIDAGEIDNQIFSATFDEFEEEDKQISLETGRANALTWSYVIKNFDMKLAYNYSALVGMNISTEEFQGLPTRAYLVKGRKVRIPHNATPRLDGSLKFDGNFDGSLTNFQFWTTCPVCIFYDLLTNKRYGAGHFIKEANLSWVDLYPLARYANELLDGEPRFACNVQVSSQAEAFTVLQDFASIFRGMMYWQSNTIQVTADHGNLRNPDFSIDPIAPVHIFSNSNVVGGVFNYSGSSLKTRSTSIKIRYSDPENLYKPNVICIEDPDLISKYGYQVKEVLAFGCTSKNQAKRMGRWMMKCEELDANTVTFAVGLDGALVFPGQVFAIQDELRATQRLSGRINSRTLNQIITDHPITLPPGGEPKLTCVLTDGTVETRDIQSVGISIVTNITVTNNFSSLPLQGSIYSVSTDERREQKFRCLSVADNGDGTFTVVAVEFNDSIYEAADKNENLKFEDVSVVDERPPIPII